MTVKPETWCKAPLHPGVTLRDDRDRPKREGLDYYFPDTTLQMLDGEAIVDGILDQARERGMDIQKMKRDLRKYLMPGTVLSRQFTALLIILSDMHRTRAEVLSSLEEGNYVSIRAMLLGIIGAEATQELDEEEWLEGI